MSRVPSELREVARARLRATGLCSSPATRSVTGVVSHLTAMQSQEYPLARWSIGQRAGVGDVDVEARLIAGEVLRTHVLRPTWHFVTAADIRGLLALTGPRVQVAMGSWYKKLGLTPEIRTRTNDVLVEVLRGGVQLERDEVFAALQDAGVTFERMALNNLLLNAELEGVICSGGAPGRQHSYALLDHRVPATAAFSRPEALADLARRYFTSHGPATERDFAWWSSLTLADVRAALAEIRSELVSFDLDGLTFWSGEAALADDTPTDRVLLLQTFDEWVVAHRDSRFVIDLAGIANMVGSEWGTDGHPVVADGQVVGHWRRKLTAERVVVSVAPRTEVTPKLRRQIEAAVTELAEFYQREGELALVSSL